MNRLFVGMAMASVAAGAFAETMIPDTDENILTARVETRFDYQRDWTDGSTVKPETGFKAKFLNLRIDGNITDNLSYSWRQRFSKTVKDGNFFDATDWMVLNYQLGDWTFSGGKQIVAIGGWEYDRAPIDLYGCSVFWNNIPCYDVGASVAYKITPHDKLTAQFCESPFFTPENRDMYAYNLMWNGSHGIFDAIYSANLIEYKPGHFINYLALGNKFTMGPVCLELDVMNRASSGQTFFFKDMSVMGEIAWKPDSRWRVFGKMTYDVNRTHTDADVTVQAGTEMKMVGAGVEFFPFSSGRHVVSLHAEAFYSWGSNANRADVMQNKTMLASLGVKWYMDLLSLKRK